MAKIGPTVLGEIHGDLNIHNILCQLESEDYDTIVLIDPRGVTLLNGSVEKRIEHGNYAYDISKLTFSLAGFSEIRKKFYPFFHAGEAYQLKHTN